MGATKVKKSTGRKDALLPQTRGDLKRSDRCGACSRFILLLLPILGCTCVLLSLLLLMYRLDVPITEASISQCIADYDSVAPKAEILICIMFGATVMFIVAIMRNIQINVYHRRQRDETKAMWIVNLIAAIANILSYVGFVILAIYDVDGPGHSTLIHYVGAFMFFILNGVYGVLHIYLLCKQVQYPMFCKIIFTLVPLAMITCSVMYIVDQSNFCAFEWFSVALAAINVGLLSILFFVDSVDDELRDFFCCRVRR